MKYLRWRGFAKIYNGLQPFTIFVNNSILENGLVLKIHWNVSGCPEVHMIFNDWMEDQMSDTIPAKRSTHLDVCECLLKTSTKV